MDEAAQFPRVFQANIDRFYQRVIVPALAGLPRHAVLTVGETASMDAFLGRCAAQVDNHTADEAAKAFALTLDGLFERQLSRWARAHGSTANGLDKLLTACTQIASIDLDAIGIAQVFRELHLAANVIRHGEGRSSVELRRLAPHLWGNETIHLYDLAPGPTPASEELRIRADDLMRYARAIICFWGHADPLPMAVREPSW
jgi:hypothetical protein